jgi:CubicO group peptidase (beta-lactamase class C family)
MRICQSADLQYADVCAGTGSEELIQFQWTGTENSSAAFAAPAGQRRYLVASITKPVVAMAVLQLVTEGRLRLNAKLCELLPEFDVPQMRSITVRHLLTHSSGLPDMLPENEQLRIDHAPRSAFVSATARCRPDFPAGTDCRYSSMGIAALGAILEKLTGISLPDLIEQKLFAPLNMQSSWLGLPEDTADALMPTVIPSQLPVWQDPSSNWNWNSRYWRTLGAPWGGLITTAHDLGRFARMMLNNGAAENPSASIQREVLSPLVVAAATQNQTEFMPDLPEKTRRHQRWGLGWRLNWLNHAQVFCELLPETTFGHWGATGTMMWISRETGTWAVILTNMPYEQSSAPMQQISNCIASTLLNSL